VWSGPRNLSTALMYSWRQRTDTTVVDEPLYAHYLRSTGIDHPGRDDVLAAQSDDAQRVISDVLLADYDTPVVVFKQMAKHLQGLDRSFLSQFRNILLTRDPFEMLTSFQVNVPDADLGETGYVELNEILDSLLASGEEPVVIETKELLANPRSVLAQVCQRVGLDFDPAMLSWPAGPKPEDGVWAPHWYEGVHRSTGWQPYSPKQAELVDSLVPVLEQAQPLYERLLPYIVRA
ncbi:MAG: hypothetical protein KDB16_10510, partial [Acidimicrobiales bacterium]|nr:hypothetical protein [Acidimicrobiales bacterium]